MRPSKCNKITDFRNTTCKSIGLYSVPSLHIVDLRLEGKKAEGEVLGSFFGFVGVLDVGILWMLL